MYVVVMGGGRVGMNLASFLIADGYDVTLIENNRNLCAKAADELDALVICGNGTDIKILNEANVSSADVFVAATGYDDSNLLSCILVKEYNIPKIIARVSEPSHAEAFKKVGVDSVISPEITAASYLENLIIRPKIADLNVLGESKAELLDITLGNANVIGKKIDEFSPNENFIIVACHENGDINIPKPGKILQKGMKVSILAKTESVNDVMRSFV